MSEQPTEADIKAARIAYIDRCQGAMNDLIPGIESLYARNFGLAVCMVPLDGAGPIIPLWDIVGDRSALDGPSAEPPETTPTNPDPCEPEPSTESNPVEGSTPKNRIEAQLKPNGVNRGDT